MSFNLGIVFMTSSWTAHAVLTTTTNQLEQQATEKGWTKDFLMFSFQCDFERCTKMTQSSVKLQTNI